MISRVDITENEYFRATIDWRYFQFTDPDEKDVIHLQPCYDLQGSKKFVSSEILGFYQSTRMASRPWTWKPFRVDTDYKRLLTIIRAAQYLAADDLLEYIAGVLQLPPRKMWKTSVDRMTRTLRSVVKTAVFHKQVDLDCCICGGSFRCNPPAVEPSIRLPCCGWDVHPGCLESALVGSLFYRCPHCQMPLNAEGIANDFAGPIDYIEMRKGRQRSEDRRRGIVHPGFVPIDWDSVVSSSPTSSDFLLPPEHHSTL